MDRLDALRKIYIARDENQLLAKIFSHTFQTDMMMRVGNLIFRNIGQLLPEQLKTFHTNEHIFPVRWSRVECSIAQQWFRSAIAYRDSSGHRPTPRSGFVTTASSRTAPTRQSSEWRLMPVTASTNSATRRPLRHGVGY